MNKFFLALFLTLVSIGIADAEVTVPVQIGPVANATGGAGGDGGNANAAALAGASATSNSNSNSGAVAIVNNTPTNIDITNSSATVSLQDGAISNTVNAGSASANNEGVTQLSLVQTGGTNVTVEAAKAVPDVAPMPMAIGAVPQLFHSSATANEVGVAITLQAMKGCKTKAVRGYDTKSRTYKGISGMTNITFVPNINYAKATKKDVAFSLPGGDYVPSTSKPVVTVDEVASSFDEVGHYKCLGIITVVADASEADNAPLSTVNSDAENFPIQNMEGFSSVTVLSTQNAIATTAGTDNSGLGVGLGASASQFFDPVLGALGASASKSKGNTFGASKVGVTYLVLVKTTASDPEGVFIDLSEKKVEQVHSPIAKPQPPVSKPKPVVKKKLAKKQDPKVLAPVVIDCTKGCQFNGKIEVTSK